MFYRSREQWPERKWRLGTAKWSRVLSLLSVRVAECEFRGPDVGNLGDLHGISSEFPNDPCTSDCKQRLLKREEDVLFGKLD